LTRENVVRVQKVFTEALWNTWLPNADAIYSYEKFLKAAAKFPAFCGESNSSLGLNEDDTCRREIANLFANMNHNSEGLSKK